MKKNLILYIIIFILLALIILLTFYKFNLHNKSNDIDENKFTIIDVVEKQNNTNDIDYLNDYSNYIIFENILILEYFIVDGDNAIYGELMIDDGKNLYLTDKVNNKTKRLLDNKKIESLYNFGEKGQNGLKAYALCEDGIVYIIYLDEINIDMVIVSKLNISVKIDKFTNLKLRSYMGSSSNSIVLYGKDKKMYDAFSEIYYDTNALNIFDKYVVFNDKSISNIYGSMMVDKDGKNYKVKYVFLPTNENVFEYSPNIIIITENNKLIYLISDDKTYEYCKDVSDVFYDENYIYIKFIDNTSIRISGIFDEKNFSLTKKK